MAHFARLDENNFVTEVLVIGNQDILDKNGQESEEVGIQFCKNLFGQNTNWVQTSYNKNFRKRFASFGRKYIPETDIFADVQPYPSWTYNITTDEWEPPIPKPQDSDNYTWEWNEINQSWTPSYKN